MVTRNQEFVLVLDGNRPMTLISNVDLVVYALVGFLAVFVVSQQKRLNQTKGSDCSWSKLFITWLLAMMIGAGFLGARYAFMQVGQRSAIRTIETLPQAVVDDPIPVPVEADGSVANE